MPYFAKVPCKIQRDGTIVVVPIGEEIPEAYSWPNREAWISSGHLEFREDRGKAKAAPKPTVPESDPEPEAELEKPVRVISKPKKSAAKTSGRKSAR